MKKKKILTLVIISTMLIVLSIHGITFADVGGYQRYDSGSSSSSSSSSHSSGSSSSGRYSSSSGSSYRSSGSSGDSGIGGLITLAIVFAIIIIVNKNKKKPLNSSKIFDNIPDTYHPEYTGDNTELVATQVKAIDPNFSAEKFLAWSKEVFIKLQNAWTDRDWKKIRPFESNELFQQHSAQLQEFIDNHTINVMERICVKYAELHDFRQDGDKEVLTITLKSVMIDYIMDEKTKKVLKGDKVTDRHMTYRLTFARKAGVKTKEGASNISTTNCPNCGAPTQITSAGECEYCGSVITTGEHDWVLINLEAV